MLIIPALFSLYAWIVSNDTDQVDKRNRLMMSVTTIKPSWGSTIEYHRTLDLMYVSVLKTEIVLRPKAIILLCDLPIIRPFRNRSFNFIKHFIIQYLIYKLFLLCYLDFILLFRTQNPLVYIHVYAQRVSDSDYNLQNSSVI